MSETPASERYRALVAAALPDLASGNAWLDRQRDEAFAILQRQPLPERRQEAWRYSGIDRLLARQFVLPPATAETGRPDISAHCLAADTWRIVLIDGRFDAGLSVLPDETEGLRVGSLAAALGSGDERVRASLQRAARRDKSLFTALNSALLGDGLWLHLAADTVLDRPVELVSLTRDHAEPVTIQPRHLVVLERGARATLIERHAALDAGGGFANHLAELILAEGAGLEHLRLVDDGPAAFHLTSLFVRQDAWSRYALRNFIIDGGWVRNEVEIDLAGPEAEASIDGLFIAGDRQTCDIQLDIRHHAPHCRSETTVKGIAHGRGRGVFDGRILVARDAQKTEAHLANDNLLLSDTAEIDTKPQLEIFADDVKCSHGTTVGQLDPNQLFYLRSRGIPAREAYGMLCHGFAAGIVEACGDEGFRAAVTTRLDERLAAMGDGNPNY